MTFQTLLCMGGQSYHPESNHINLTTFPSSSQQRYDDIIPGSREVTRSREATPREAIKLVSGPEVVAAGPSIEGSYPSTSASTSGAPNAKIQVVHLRAGGSDFDSVASFDSFVMDGRGFPKAGLLDRYYTAGYSWNGNVNKDSSDYSSDDDDDDNCGMERGAIFSPSRPSAIPRTFLSILSHIGQSYHPESNHINLTTFPSSSQQRYDDIIPGSREVTRSREATPREAIKLVSGPEVVAGGPSTEGSYPSTSASTSGAPNAKIQVVHLRAGGSDFDSVASFDSFVMDGRGFPKARYVDRYYTAGYSWNGNVNKDSSDYSSDDDDDDNCGMERGAIFSPSRPSAIPRTVRGNHLYQSLPLNESGSNDGGCKVHIVQWPSAVRTGYHSPFQMCMNGESSDHYHSAPTQRSVDDLNRGYPSGKHKTLIVESSNCNTFPKNYHPMMNLKREYHHDPHSVYTTQDVTGTITQDLTGATSQEGYPTECTPFTHHSQSFSENSNPSSKQSTAASAVAGGLKYDHRFTHPPQRTKLDDRGVGYQTCQNFHEHRSKSEKSHSYPPIDCPGTFNEMSEANNGTDGPARDENCEPHPLLQEGNPQNVASTSCTNHNTADDPERAQPHME
nr:uncharacterized protein LOC129267540 [Lytechinus pictus]